MILWIIINLMMNKLFKIKIKFGKGSEKFRKGFSKHSEIVLFWTFQKSRRKNDVKLEIRKSQKTQKLTQKFGQKFGMQGLKAIRTYFWWSKLCKNARTYVFVWEFTSNNVCKYDANFQLKKWLLSQISLTFCEGSFFYFFSFYYF